MHVKTRNVATTGLLTAIAALAMLVFVPNARADTFRIVFNGTYDFGADIGTPFSGYADLTIGSNPSASNLFPSPGDPAPATRVDPEHSQSITGVTGGMFNGHVINPDVMGIGGGCLPPTEYLPASCTDLFASNTPDGAPAVTFDNLFYASGSPLVCLGIDGDGNTTVLYPYSGGFLDLYGVLLTLDDGTMLDLWSNGVMPGLGLNYGLILFAPADENYTVLSAQFQGVFAAVPEPGYVWLLGAGLLGLLVWLRSRTARAADRID